MTTYNHYSDNGLEPAVRFDLATESCVSIGDVFDETASFACVDKLLNLRVQNHSATNLNIVMNVQDEFQIPFGFCGNIVINGNLRINGNLFIDGSIINVQAPIIPAAGTLITSILYGDGNIIHFEYGMNIGGPAPGGIYRVGTLRIAHNGDGNLVAPTIITFDDNYTEVGGPPANLITLSAVLDGPGPSGAPNFRVNIVVDDPGSLFPTYNFTTRIMTV